MTAFFIPNADPERQEHLYAALAELARVPPAPPDKRIRAIRWAHDGDTWIAEVGKQLSGTRVRPRTRQGRRIEVTTPLHDSATVQAIFPGGTYVVVTDARPLTSRGSSWENPFYAGIPESVTYFDGPKTPKAASAGRSVLPPCTTTPYGD